MRLLRRKGAVLRRAIEPDVWVQLTSFVIENLMAIVKPHIVLSQVPNSTSAQWEGCHPPIGGPWYDHGSFQTLDEAYPQLANLKKCYPDRKSCIVKHLCLNPSSDHRSCKTIYTCEGLDPFSES